MNASNTGAFLLAAALLCGCATHDQRTIAAVRAAGVSGRIVAKLEDHGSLAPGDLVELKRRGVSDAVPIRQLDVDGVDYIVQRDEIVMLRKAKVRTAVTDALIAASDRFAHDRYAPAAHGSWWVDPFWYGPAYYYRDPLWWPQTRLSVGYARGGYRRCR